MGRGMRVRVSLEVAWQVSKAIRRNFVLHISVIYHNKFDGFRSLDSEILNIIVR